MIWRKSHRCDPKTKVLADRHCNRQNPESPQFVPPGRCLVLRATSEDAFWVSSWPFEEYTKHEWAGAWICTAFRNEGSLLSSSLVVQAESATRWYWGEPPELGFVTFVNRDKVRKKRDFGRCYRKAGWVEIGETKGGLLALGHSKELIPDPKPPIGVNLRLFE